MRRGVRLLRHMFEPQPEVAAAIDLLVKKTEIALEKATRSDQMVDSIEKWRHQVDEEAEEWRKHG